jgi:hypothetical protein
MKAKKDLTVGQDLKRREFLNEKKKNALKQLTL